MYWGEGCVDFLHSVFSGMLRQPLSLITASTTHATVIVSSTFLCGHVQHVYTEA